MTRSLYRAKVDTEAKQRRGSQSMTRYIDARNPHITTEEALALYNGTAKPYPASWYDAEEEHLEYRAASVMDNIAESHSMHKSDIYFWNARPRKGAVVARAAIKTELWSTYSSPVERWQNLYCYL